MALGQRQSPGTLEAAKKVRRICCAVALPFPGRRGPESFWFSLVERTVICIDDLERRGNNLTLTEVLGLVSHLRENRNCKVAIIMNDEALGGSDLEEFSRYFEKVVDIKLSFQLSEQECIRVAFGNESAGNELAKACSILGISNIRIARKIDRAMRMLEPTLKEFHPDVAKGACRSVALLGWSLLRPRQRSPN